MVAQSQLFEYEPRPTLDMVPPGRAGLEHLAERLARRLDKLEMTAIRTWAHIVRAGGQCQPNAATREAYAALMSIYERKEAFRGAQTAPTFHAVMAKYHADGRGVCHLHDDLAVLVAGWKR